MRREGGERGGENGRRERRKRSNITLLSPWHWLDISGSAPCLVFLCNPSLETRRGRRKIKRCGGRWKNRGTNSFVPLYLLCTAHTEEPSLHLFHRRVWVLFLVFRVKSKKVPRDKKSRKAVQVKKGTTVIPTCRFQEYWILNWSYRWVTADDYNFVTNDWAWYLLVKVGIFWPQE